MKTNLPLTAGATPEKPRQEKPFVQTQGKLTEEQLEAIAAQFLSFLLISKISLFFM